LITIEKNLKILEDFVHQRFKDYDIYPIYFKPITSSNIPEGFVFNAVDGALRGILQDFKKPILDKEIITTLCIGHFGVEDIDLDIPHHFNINQNEIFRYRFWASVVHEAVHLQIGYISNQQHPRYRKWIMDLKELHRKLDNILFKDENIELAGIQRNIAEYLKRDLPAESFMRDEIIPIIFEEILADLCSFILAGSACIINLFNLIGLRESTLRSRHPPITSRINYCLKFFENEQISKISNNNSFGNKLIDLTEDIKNNWIKIKTVLDYMPGENWEKTYKEYENFMHFKKEPNEWFIVFFYRHRINKFYQENKKQISNLIFEYLIGKNKRFWLDKTIVLDEIFSEREEFLDIFSKNISKLIGYLWLKRKKIFDDLNIKIKNFTIQDFLMYHRKEVKLFEKTILAFLKNK
ncbi:MAG: hypothetical protein ACTSVV_14610, partial [Promethearchaeota archaeon]